MDNPFWEYSIAQYDRQGVAKACLSLQDEHGLDVNMLLYGAWLASLGRRPDTAHIEGIANETRQWRERVVGPVRRLRRDWKALAPAAELRSQLQAIELQAERAQQEFMLAYFRAHPPVVSPSADVEGNLVLVAGCTASGGRDWTAGVQHLSRLLSA